MVSTGTKGWKLRAVVGREATLKRDRLVTAKKQLSMAA